MSLMRKLRVYLLDNVIVGASFGVGSFLAYLLFD